MKFLLLLMALCWTNFPLLAQEVTGISLMTDDQYIPLNLKSAIEQGLRQNYDQELRQFKFSYLTIQEDRNWDQFWLPNLKFEIAVNDQRLKSFLGGSAKDQSYDRPSGMVAVGIAEYTLFNWGKDYIGYLNSKASNKRAKENLQDDRRELRLQIISEYLDVLTKNKILKIKQEQLRQATFIFRFNQDKAKLKKISQQEYYLSKSDYLRSQTEYHEAKAKLEEAERALAGTISDPIENRYKITEQIKMSRIKSTLEELLDKAQKNNPDILDSENSIAMAERNYNLSQKDSLPLPKISLKVGAYKYQFDDNQSTTRYENSLGTDSVEMVATVNATWDLLGSNGLFNSRNRKEAILARNQAIKEKEKYQHSTRNNIKSLFRQGQHVERIQDVLEAEVQSLRSSFDVTLDNYTSGKTRFTELQRTLEERTKREVQTEENKLAHARIKLLLTQYAGLDDLPGESLESITEFSIN